MESIYKVIEGGNMQCRKKAWKTWDKLDVELIKLYVSVEKWYLEKATKLDSERSLEY